MDLCDWQKSLPWMEGPQREPKEMGKQQQPYLAMLFPHINKGFQQAPPGKQKGLGLLPTAVLGVERAARELHQRLNKRMMN